MKYKTKFLLFLILLHLVEIALSLLVLKSGKFWFIAAEVMILVSVAVSVYFYVSYSRPLQLINSGIESIKDKDFSMRLVKVGQPELDNLVEVYNQMIDQLRYERTRQQEQHYFLEKLILASPTGIIILDPDEKIKMMNPAAEKFTGIRAQEANHTYLEGWTTNALVKQLMDLPSGDTQTTTISGLQKFKIHKSYFVNQGFRNHFLMIEELSNEIYQIERSAYEKVIRTISHEFNNSIGPINSILDSLQMYIRKTETENKADFETAIEAAIMRNNALNEFIRKYAGIFKLPPPVKELCNINHLMARMEKVFHYQLKSKNIALDMSLSTTPVVWKVDINQFELVVSNILKNAADAIATQGTICMQITHNPSCIVISNNGEPIHPDIQRQLFTPFFTTKKTGQGIGLTLIREILQNHGCKFSLQSTPGGITEFRIYAPAGR